MSGDVSLDLAPAATKTDSRRRPAAPAKTASGGAARTRTPKGADVLGFGFQHTDSPHHFLVTIGRTDVHISEHTAYREGEVAPTSLVSQRDDARLRAIISRHKWNLLAEAVKANFNRRLTQVGLRRGAWVESGAVPVSRPFGKELVLLAWAVEDADPARVPVAIENWKGLQPEERWWLYTMTCAATGHVTNDRGKGWRKAVRFALTENPVVLGAIDDETPITLESEPAEGAPLKSRKRSRRS